MPFSAELKRMGVVLRDLATGRITFYVKGADTVIAPRRTADLFSSLNVASRAFPPERGRGHKPP
eukprot:6009610-Prorocentrum_lima.AAC.1